MLGAAASTSASSLSQSNTDGTTWFMIWGVGAAAFFLWQLLGHQKLLREIGATSQAAEPARYGGVRVVKSQGARGALAVGLWARRIVVPADFPVRYSEPERRLVLEHELMHHRRGDMWWNWLALLLLAANWFNPIAYLAFRAFRADQELSCDAAVAARLSPLERYEYARALVKSATQQRLVAACPLNHASQLKQRLKMLKSHRDTAKLRMAGALTVGAVVAGGIALTPSHGIAAQMEVEERAAKDERKLPLLLRPVGARGLPQPCPDGKGELGPELDFGNGKLRRSVNCLNRPEGARSDLDLRTKEIRVLVDRNR
jgi:beta-lactamase regulating signal transducer with metallopeptidase domain